MYEIDIVEQVEAKKITWHCFSSKAALDLFFYFKHAQIRSVCLFELIVEKWHARAQRERRGVSTMYKLEGLSSCEKRFD